MDEADPDLRRILRGFRESAAYLTKGFWLFAAVGAVVVIAFAAQQAWGPAGLSAAFFGGMALLMLWARRRARDPAHSPVLSAILADPGSIVHVRHHRTSSSNGMFETHWLHVRTRAGKKAGIKVAEDEIPVLANALANRCPLADIEVPGYVRKVERASIT